MKMLPELLFTAVDGMQDAVSDDFDLLNGTNSIYEKGMCLAVNRVTPNNSPNLPVDQHQISSTENDTNNYVTNATSTTLLSDIKNECENSTDLFPTHPTTWQQHPMNSQEHAHHRLQNHQNRHQHRQNDRHQHRINLITSKLLLRNSDDPLICRGANSVGITDDDHPLTISITQTAEINTNNRMHRTQPAATNKPTPISSSTTICKKLPSAQQIPRKVPPKGCSSLTKQQLKVKAGLMSAQNRAINQLQKSDQQTVHTDNTNNKANETKLCKKKGIIKLRFHHQALPPEYLSHYEAKQNQLFDHIKDPKPKPPEINTTKILQTSKLPPPKTAHENVRSWLKKIAAIHRSAQEDRQREEVIHKEQIKTDIQNDKNNNYQINRIQSSKLALSAPPCNLENSEQIKSPVGKLSSNYVGLQPPSTNSNVLNISIDNINNSPSLKRVINYSDLPYMGEITLDNSKPRRGRKPKKADICHLIYKNYGTIFPGTPKNALTVINTTTDSDQGKSSFQTCDDLPLNLCMRDLQCDHLSISSSEESENICGILDENSTSKETIEPFNSCDADVEDSLESKFSILPILNNNKETPITLKIERDGESLNLTKLSKDIECSNSKDMLIHPVSLYYQKLISSGLVNQNSQPFGLPVQTIEKDNQITLKIPIPNGLFKIPKAEKLSPTLSADSRVIDYPELLSTPSSIKSETSNITVTSAASATTIANTTINQNHQQITPQKRKRSAIFIPPIPAENTTNPATEVSICKFKFTGGAKPSLQEKKMLSVDSGGNYRYYSGTGDKSTRGYEFFPRESLQSSAGFLPGVNCSHNFPTISHACGLSDIPPPSAELSNEILQIPESPTGTLLLPDSSSPSPISGSVSSYSDSPSLSTQQTQNLQMILSSDCKTDIASRSMTSKLIPISNSSTNAILESTNSSPNLLQRKKKSRRSSQREKLEKTFKEKGFLIQTQQLESAEGATYCKFRQLKKFTRYLFRNWKDYLPEEIHQPNASDRTETNNHIYIKENTREADDNSENLPDQLAIESILERHGFLTNGRLCTQNNDRSSTNSSMIEKNVHDQQSIEKIGKT